MGIDKSELRIGNYVEFPTHGIMKITELSMIGAMGKGEISGKCIWEKTVYKHIEPIRITKQILIDNGFTEYEDGRFSGGRLKYNFNIGVLYFDIAYPCKYVHQLQNLWKIINGKEMDFQMKLFIDEENEIEIKYFNRVINLFLKGRMYDKLIKDDSNYLKILKTSDKKFVLDLVEKIENEFYQTKEDVAKDYNVSFIIPKMEEYIYLPNGKIDLTKENIITIDNEGDLCLDDGLSIRDNKDGTYTLFVHLANPASIIPYTSSTMKEALKRCNTLYLLDDSIPIFDSYLSDHILSLLPNKYTNALTVKVNIDTDYSLILDTLEIIPSIIQSKHKLSYEETDDIINHGGDLNSTLMLLSRIFDKQATDNPKISAYHKLENIIRGRDNTNSSKADTSISHMMVEQSNVFANSTIYLIEKRDNLGLIMPWRVQTEDCDELINEYLKRGNFDTTNKELRRMMKEYMMRSKYSFVNRGHYGLGLGGYVRISSAARRAMDALAIYVLYDLYINRNSDDLDYKYYYWEKEIKYWCEYANIRTSENNNFISEYNYLCSRGKILKK